MRELRGKSARVDWAAAAHNVVLNNKDEGGGWVGRHALAWGFIYALLDIADAIRHQSSERRANTPASTALSKEENST